MYNKTKSYIVTSRISMVNKIFLQYFLTVLKIVKNFLSRIVAFSVFNLIGVIELILLIVFGIQITIRIAFSIAVFRFYKIAKIVKIMLKKVDIKY